MPPRLAQALGLRPAGSAGTKARAGRRRSTRTRARRRRGRAAGRPRCGKLRVRARRTAPASGHTRRFRARAHRRRWLRCPSGATIRSESEERKPRDVEASRAGLQHLLSLESDGVQLVAAAAQCGVSNSTASGFAPGLRRRSCGGGRKKGCGFSSALRRLRWRFRNSSNEIFPRERGPARPRSDGAGSSRSRAARPAPRSSRKSSVGVNCTLSRAASCFSLVALPSVQVTSRSPQMLSASATKCLLRLVGDRRLAEVDLHQPLAVRAAVLAEVQHDALALRGRLGNVVAQVEQRLG